MIARLDDAVQRYLDHLTVERGSAANTVSSYRRDLVRYKDFLASRGISTLSEVAEADVREFLVALRRGDPERDVPPLADSSVARTLVATRGFHKFAAAEGIVADDVAHAVRPPKPAQRLPKALAVDEVLAILDAAGAPDHPRALRDRALLELLYSCGARISEVTALDVDDIDTEHRAVVLRGKGGKERIVPVGRPAIAAVDAYLVRGRPALAKKGTPALFLNIRGGRLSRQSAWQVLVECGGTRGRREGSFPAHPPPQLRHPSPRRRRGCARGAGVAGPFFCDDHPGVHAGHGEHHAGGVRHRAPPRAIADADAPAGRAGRLLSCR